MFSFSKSLAALGGLLLVSMVFVNLVAAGDSAVQDPKKTQLEGVWKPSEVVPPASSANEKPTSISPQPGLLIFTKGYYSGMAVTGTQPRTAAAPPKDPNNLTDAEKIARYEQWAPFIANAGTYDVKGSTLTMRPMVAKNPNVMGPESTIIWELKVEGANAFWLIPPADRAATAARVKFTRLE